MEMSYIGGDLDVMGNSLDRTEERGLNSLPEVVLADIAYSA